MPDDRPLTGISSSTRSHAGRLMTGTLDEAPLWHVIVTGQSNGNGVNTGTLWPTTYSNVLGFATSSGTGMARPGGAANSANFARIQPMVAGSGGVVSGGETVAIGLGHMLNQLSGYRVLVSVAALDGSALNGRDEPGETWYDNIVYQYQQGVIQGAVKLSIVTFDGEAEVESSNVNFGTQKSAFRGRLVTSFGTSDFVIYENQQVHYSTGASGTNWSYYPGQFEDELAEANLSQFQVVAQMFAAEGGDSTAGSLHRANNSQRNIGALNGAAIYRKQILGETRCNVRITSAVRTGTNVDCTCSVPSGTSLALNYALMGKNTTAGKPGGVSWYDDSASVTASTLTITGTNTFRVGLSGTPSGTNPQIRIGDSTGSGSQQRWSGSGRVNLGVDLGLTAVDGSRCFLFASVQRQAVT